MNGQKMGENTHRDALTLLFKREYLRALDILERLEESSATLNDRAVALHQVCRDGEALALLDKALNIEPDYVPAVLNRRYMGLAIDAAPAPPRFRVVEDWGPPQCPVPAVSVVIPTYDRPEHLEESVRSVIDQTYKNFELVVVSDGGPQEAQNILRNLGADRIRYVSIEHGGISAALNAGVAHSRGRYIAYLDDDDVYFPNHLETLAGYLDSHPDAKFAYSISKRHIFRPKGDSWETHDITSATEPYNRELLRESNYIQTTGGIIHRRELMEEVGGFNERIIGCQDWEWYLRVSEKHDLHFINCVTLEHRVKDRPGTQLSADRRIMRRNNITVRYMYRLLLVASDAPGKFGYRRMSGKLKRFLAQWPDLIDVLDLNELATRKPYAFFLRLGRDLSAMGDFRRARAAYVAAFTIAPWELKSLGGIIRP